MARQAEKPPCSRFDANGAAWFNLQLGLVQAIEPVCGISDRIGHVILVVDHNRFIGNRAPPSHNDIGLTLQQIAARGH